MREYVFTVPIGFNSYSRLDKTLASLRAQSLPVKIAICHVGDRSDIEHILKPYADIIEYERHAPDAGQSAAINEGWAALQGDVYGWLNTDDYLAPNALEIVDALFDQHIDADVVYGQSLIINTDDVITGLHPTVQAPDRSLLYNNYISQPSCFTKRETLDQVGYVQEHLQYAMDWDLWVRMLESGKKFVYTPEVLSVVLWDTDTKTGSMNFQRLREIRDIVSRSNQPVRTLKTMVGFLLQHISENTIFSKPLKIVLGLKKNGRFREARYWSSTPSQSPEVAISIFHYSADAHSELILSFFKRGERTVAIDGIQKITSSDQDLVVPHEFSSGKTFKIEISGRDFQSGDIDFLTWR
jgi:glycosyltransferase involved in cell wall biosynthesis